MAPAKITWLRPAARLVSAQVCRARLHSARGRPSSGRQDPASPHSCVRRRRTRRAHQSRAHVEAEGRDGPGDSLLVSASSQAGGTIHSQLPKSPRSHAFLAFPVQGSQRPSGPGSDTGASSGRQLQLPQGQHCSALSRLPTSSWGGCHQEPLAGRSPFQTQLPLCFGHIPGVKAALCWEQPLDPWLSRTWAQSLPSCWP